MSKNKTHFHCKEFKSALSKVGELTNKEKNEILNLPSLVEGVSRKDALLAAALVAEMVNEYPQTDVDDWEADLAGHLFEK